MTGQDRIDIDRAELIKTRRDPYISAIGGGWLFIWLLSRESLLKEPFRSTIPHHASSKLIGSASFSDMSEEHYGHLRSVATAPPEPWPVCQCVFLDWLQMRP